VVVLLLVLIVLECVVGGRLPRRSTESHIDPSGRERVERAERLGHFVWTVMIEEYCSRADPNVIGLGREMGDQHFRGRARRRVTAAVMLGHPESGIAEFFGPLSQFDGVVVRIRRRATLGNRPETDNRQLHAIRIWPRVNKRSFSSGVVYFVSQMKHGFGGKSANERC
jgi:hypothetical protein